MKQLLTPAHLLMLMVSLGVGEMDMDVLFEHAGVPADRLADPDGMISLDEVTALIRSALELTGDPALGLHMGAEIGVEMMDVAGMLFSTAPDLRTAIKSYVQHIALVSTFGTFSLQEEGELVYLRLHLIDVFDSELAYVAGELAAACGFGMFRRLVKGDFHVREVYCRHAEPAWIEEYRVFLGEETRLIFDADEYCCVFDRHMLDLPMARHSPGLHQRLREQAALRLASLPRQEDTSAVVQRLIDESLGESLVDLALIADRMGIGPRTLQRRLREEKTNFLSLLDACRFKRAKEILSKRDTPVDELAAHLGYSESTAFGRAFKSWCGVPPLEYRQRYQGY